MSEPASLNVGVSLTGLSNDELSALLRNMPAGARWEGVTVQPAIGGARNEVTVSNLSIKGAADLTESLLSYLGDDGGRAEHPAAEPTCVQCSPAPVTFRCRELHHTIHPN